MLLYSDFKENKMDLKKEFDMRSKLMHISRNLKIYDKISVIFFVCDKPYAGLTMMNLLLTTESKSLQTKAFYAWAKKQMLFSRTDWSERFAEILALIQNYKLCRYLGHVREELMKKITSKCGLLIPEIKIALYRLCEALNQAQTLRLVDSIDKNHGIVDSNDMSKNYLESRLFYWCVKNIISIDSENGINLEVIISYLKALNLNHVSDDILVFVKNIELKLLKSIRSITFHNSLPDYYEIKDKTNLGLCVMINEKNFSGSDFKQRWGSNKDVDRLKEVFTAFGFRIKIHTNVFFEDLINLLHKYAKMVSVNDSFFVLIILSHGSENVIYTSDSVPVPMDAIEMIFQAENCPNLIGKPKIFIIQSCQGQKWQKVLQQNAMESDNSFVWNECEIGVDAPNTSVKSNTVKITGPQKGDSIIAWSTVLGYASFRDKHNGSWYIEELCKQLWKYGQVTDLVEILTLVNNNLRSKVFDGQFMVPSLLSSLSGKIQFPSVKENWLRGREMMFKRLFFESYFMEFLRNSKISDLNLLKLKDKN